MQVLESWQSTIASNLANASTPGYQKSNFSISAPKSASDNNLSAAGARNGLTLPVGRITPSFADGGIRTTSNPTDFALGNGGFFAVSGDAGERLFTKDGEFHLDSEGVLVNKMGYTVDVEGGELTVDLQKGPITVTSDGSVSQDGASLGIISSYAFSNPNELERLSGSYFSDSKGSAGERLMEEDAAVMQGHLMGSSISALGEMVSMIEASRAYEMGQKLIQESDQRLSDAIQAFSV